MSGAVVRLGPAGLFARRDFKSLPEIAIAIKSLAVNEVDRAVIEQVHAMPGQGVCSMFSFGKAAGVAFGALFSAGLIVREVSPQKWQNFFRLKLGIARDREFDSREICLDLFPGYRDLFKWKKDHNTGDAVLLALWDLWSTDNDYGFPARGREVPLR